MTWQTIILKFDSRLEGIMWLQTFCPTFQEDVLTVVQLHSWTFRWIGSPEGGGDSLVSSLYWSLHHRQRCTYDFKISSPSSVVTLREQLFKEFLDNSQ